MRSVVVVLPASMWAMMPMLRTLFRSVSTSSATVVFPFSGGGRTSGGSSPGARRRPGGPGRRSELPAVVREGLVGLSHLVHVLAALDSGPEAVGGVEDLVHEALGHRLLAASARVVDEPAQREGGRTRGA